MLKQRVILAMFGLSLALNVIATILGFSLWTVPALLLGWYAADAASGLVHMYMDYRPTPEGKQLDELFFFAGSRESSEYLDLLRARMANVTAFQRLVYDFKNHHPRPMALGRRSLWRLIGSTVTVATLPISLALNVAVLTIGAPSWLIAFGVALLLGGAFAQYFHGTLHRDDNPWIVTAARRVGLLMTPEAHQLHHETLRRDFATNCGWSNPAINAVFRALRARGHLDDAGLVPRR